MTSKSNDRTKGKKANEPEDLRAALSHDYKIPGISPRFYIPVLLVVLVVVVSWGTILSWDYDFLLGLLVLIAISTASSSIQRLLKHLRRL